MSDEYLFQQWQEGKYIVKILNDEDPPNPRTDWDPFGHMLCEHKRYNLGDPKLAEQIGFRSGDYSSWDRVEEWLYETQDISCMLPIYMYDHSGITINTTGFFCPWDSGQIGFIYCTRKEVAKDFDGDVDRALACLQCEVKTYDQYIQGEVYGWVIQDGGETVESCWGYYDEEDCIGDAKDTLEYLLKQDGFVEGDGI